VVNLVSWECMPVFGEFIWKSLGYGIVCCGLNFEGATLDASECEPLHERYFSICIIGFPGSFENSGVLGTVSDRPEQSKISALKVIQKILLRSFS
jgi:hypothetical protein